MSVHEVEQALADGAPVESLLPEADAAIEAAIVAADGGALGRLAVTLERGAVQRAPDRRALSLAAARARLGWTRLGSPGLEGAEPAPARLPAWTVPSPVGLPPADAAAAIRYAGFGRRLAAFLIDWLILASVLLPLGEAAGWGDGGLTVFWGGAIAYFAFLPHVMAGRTIGKTILGMAVRRRDGRPAELGSLVGRTLVLFLLLGTIVGALVDAIVCGASDESRSLHDRAAGTVVIRT